MTFSIILPVHNEAENLRNVVQDIHSIFRERGDDFEIVIVNDGSTDNSGSIADELSQTFPEVNVIHHEVNKGYGAALTSGFVNAHYEWIFFTDTDRQFDVSEINILLPYCADHDLICGYRKKRRDPCMRRWYGKMWSMVGQALFSIPIRDLNCAFKLLRSNKIRSIPFSSHGAMINMELVAYAVKRGYRIKEVPVSHFPRQFGKQSGARCSVVLKAFQELWVVWKNLKRSRP